MPKFMKCGKGRDWQTLSQLVAVVFLISVIPSRSSADGGALRCTVHQDQLQIAVFTSPTPPRAGPIDVSVLVQGAAGEARPDARVVVECRLSDNPGRIISATASRGAATNQFLSAALLDLPEAGQWQVRVRVEQGGRRGEAAFTLDVAEPLPGWLPLAEWLAWPAGVIALYALHRLLVSRKERAARRTIAAQG